MHRGMHASVQELGEYQTRVMDLSAFAYTVAPLETYRRYSFRVWVRNKNQLGYVNSAIGCPLPASLAALVCAPRAQLAEHAPKAGGPDAALAGNSADRGSSCKLTRIRGWLLAAGGFLMGCF